MKKGFIAFLLFPVFLFSQKEKFLFFESGASTFVPFDNPYKSSGTVYGWAFEQPPPIIGYYNATTKFDLSPSFYCKAGVEFSIFKKRKFGLSIPLIIGFREQKFKYTTDFEQFYYGSSSIDKYQETTLIKEDCVSFIFGLKVTYDFNKFSLFTSVLFNSDLFYSYKYLSVENGYFDGRVQFGRLNRFLFNISLQNGITYNINARLGIGFTCDVFLFNLNSFDSHGKSYQHFFNSNYRDLLYPYPINPPSYLSSIINTGIRLQYKFGKIKWPIIPIPENLQSN